MTKMATMPIYCKNPKKSSSPEPIEQQPCNLICSILYACTTKIVQIMTLSYLDLFYANVKFGPIGFCMSKSENYVLFGNYCSHRPQKWFKYLNK